MAWAQSDLDTIDAALKGNVRSVTFADGRAVSYESKSEMLKVRDLIKAELAAAGSQVNRVTRGVYRRR